MSSAAFWRKLRRFTEPLGVRLVPMLGVCAAACGILALHGVRSRGFVASAVTAAAPALHGIEASGTVEQIHVAIGVRVAAGQTLVSLRSLALDAERLELDAEIQRVLRAGVVAQLKTSEDSQQAALSALTRLAQAERDQKSAFAERELQASLVEDAKGYLERMEELAKAGVLEERAVWTQERLAARQRSLEKQAGELLQAESERAGKLRKELGGKLPSGSLLEATARLYEAELALLERRRINLADRAALLTVRARIDGRVTELARIGASVRVGDSVATVMPEHALEVVAYTPPELSPPPSTDGVPFSVELTDGRHCDGTGNARSSGSVEPKPGQLMPLSNVVSYGFPVRVSLPVECALPIGQVVQLRMADL